MTACPLCKFSNPKMDPIAGLTFTFDCEGCGHYRITDSAVTTLKHTESSMLLASWVYQQNSLGLIPSITAEFVEVAKRDIRVPSLNRRMDLYLSEAVHLLGGRLFGTIIPNDRRLLVASWTPSDRDAVAIADFWILRGAFEKNENPTLVTIGPSAILHYEELAARRASTSQAFVAMSFSKDLLPAYADGIAPAIAAAGYESLRLDYKDHEGKIDDRIIAEIRQSAFLIADLTDQRGGVYYEAGFAHGLEKKVIFTCRKDELDKTHFDIRQYNILQWETPQGLVAPLQNRILAVFGAGPLKPDAKSVAVA